MDLNYVPKTLKEAHEYLDNYLQDKDDFKDHPENDVIEVSHSTLGRWLRNKWYLWWNKELAEEEVKFVPDYPLTKPELVEWFNSIGVQYADDMSAIVIISYHKLLNNRPYDLDEDVRVIKEFYENQQTEQDIIQSKKNEQE